MLPIHNRPREPWNKGQIVGQKKPLKLKEIWAIRIQLQMEHDQRGLALKLCGFAVGLSLLRLFVLRAMVPADTVIDVDDWDKP